MMWQTPDALKRAVWKRIYSAPEHGFIYFRIPKSANSTVTLALSRHVHGHAGRSAKRQGRRFGLGGIRLERQWRQQFTFTFVRDPFARVLSAYLDKVAEGDSKFLSVLGMREPPDFPGFLSALEAGALHANAHWAPQADLIPLAPTTLSFVGRVENMERDLGLVLERLFGVTDGVPESPLRRTQAAAKLKSYFGPDQIEKVRRLYARDFALFYPGRHEP